MSIGSAAFSLCGLYKIIIPSKVESIGTGAFLTTQSIDIYCTPTTPPKLAGKILSRGHIYVDKKLLESYKTATIWREFSEFLRESTEHGDRYA